MACLALSLTACQHAARPEGTVASANASAPLMSATANNSRSLILGVGPGHSSTLGRWHVEISDDTALHVSRLSASGRTTVSPGAWRARDGACVFVENDERLWAHDGHHNLFLIVSTGKTLASYGPRSFPCAIPQEIAERLATKPEGPTNRSSQ